MGLFSNKIDEQSLKPGDHIYTWRGLLKLYSHHGIYVGNGQVIHFGKGLEPEIGPESFKDKLKAKAKAKANFFRTVINSNSTPRKTCSTCNLHLQPKGVTKSCLQCFLDGGDLYRYEYGVRGMVWKLKRAGTCTTEIASDDVGKILQRAKYLLGHEVGFGEYDMLNRNCEDFALYCTLELIGTRKGANAQAARFHQVVRVERIEVEDLVAKMEDQSQSSK